MKLPYFKLGEAVDDIKSKFSYGNFADKAASVAKLGGKTVANAGLLAVEVGVYVAKNAPAAMAKVAENAAKKK